MGCVGKGVGDCLTYVADGQRLAADASGTIPADMDDMILVY